MKLEELVPSLETCKKLKEAGFEQNTLICWIEIDEENFFNSTRWKKWVLRNSNFSSGDYLRAPTLGEIEFSENIIIEYVKYSGYYIIKHTVDKKEIIKAFQSNSEIEARAALWLYLNKK